MPRTLKIPSKQLNSIILVKLLSGKEQRDIFLDLLDYADDLEKHSDLLSYYKLVVSKVIANLDEILISWKGISDSFSDLTEEEVYKLLYSCVLKAYGGFALEAVCEKVNAEAFVEEFKDDIVFVKGVGPLLKSAHPELQEAINDQIKKVKKPKAKVKKVSNSDFEELRLKLLNRIVGQNETVNKLVDYLKCREANLFSTFVFLLIGKTGQGKTHTARALADLYMDGRLLTIDCSQATEGHEKSVLLGSPPGYIGHTGTSYLAEKAKVSNEWVILLDEVEKANTKMLDNLMNFIETGRILDSSGKDLDFSRSVFILTSNEGIDYTTNAKIGWDSKETTQTKEEIISNLESFFKREFINRIDEVIVVNSLTKENLKQIAKLELSHYPVNITDDLLNYVVDNGYSEHYGARNLKRFIRRNIGVAIAEKILSSNKNKKALYNFKDGQFFSDGGAESEALGVRDV